MKIVLATIALVASLAVVQSISAEDPLDLGEVSPLIVACQQATAIGQASALTVKWCRREKPDAVVGNTAVIYARIGTNMGPISLTIKMTRSLWTTAAITVNG
jgi:hypothetical protein